MTPSSSSFVVALDGPAASGKGTLGRKIADHFGFAYLDTGSLYRGVAWLILQAGADPENEEAAGLAARGYSQKALKDANLRTAEIAAAASKVAAIPAVRSALLDFQRNFARTPPEGEPGAVLDGRDIGTIVCPDADLKFFVVADPEIRAKRRFLELKPTRPDITEADVFADLKVRDARDAAREDAPMVQADDAELLDTTHLTIEAAFAAARRAIDGIFQSK